MNSINKKTRNIPQPPNRTAGHAHRFQPAVAQLKTAAPQVKRPVAPPAYRPQPVPKVLQTKSAVPQARNTTQAPRQSVAPPVYRAPASPKILQAKMALNRTSPMPQQRAPRFASGTVQLASEKQALVKKIEENTNKTYSASTFLGNARSKVQSKGWTETVANTFTKGASTLAVAIQDEHGDYRFSGTYNDGTATAYRESYLTLRHESKSTVAQDYIFSDPHGQGIGYLLSLVAGRYLTGLGYTKVAISMQNQNSAPLARGLNEGGGESTGCCSWCFLTTACVEARGLPDDCDELSTLREFRDTYMSSSKHLRALVDLYYEIAPRIVQAIEASENRREELDAIYQTIVTCVDLVKRKQYERAVEIYKRCVIRLANQYL